MKLAAWVGGLAVTMIGLNGCNMLTATAPSRTLDPEIRRVYVPQVRNDSSQFGLGPRVTTALQDAILADGRLELVREPQADARVEVRLSEYEERILATSDDEFPLVSELSVLATADLWDPYQKVRTIPLARRQVLARYTYVGDPRRTLSDSGETAQEKLAEAVGNSLYRQILTGQDVEPTDAQRRAQQREQRLFGPTRVIPEVDPARFPDSSRIPVKL